MFYKRVIRRGQEEDEYFAVELTKDKILVDLDNSLLSYPEAVHQENLDSVILVEEPQENYFVHAGLVVGDSLALVKDLASEEKPASTCN